MSWGEDLPDYMGHAIYCTSFRDLTIDGFYGAPARNGLAAIELVNGEGAVLRNLRASHPAMKLLEQKNIKP